MSDAALRKNYKNMTKEQARAFLREIMGPPTRTLEGQEKAHILLLLAMIEPFKETNNQRSWTSYYMIGDVEYHVTNFDGEEIVDVLLEDDE